MRLDDEERAMLAGQFGEARRWAIDHQIRVGRYLGAADFVAVSQAHIMADTEATGEAGVAFVESLAAMAPEHRRVAIPTITDPRGVDFDAYKRLKQTPGMVDIEARLIRAFEALGVMLTNTCINYQTILPPVHGEHLAFGDTGVVIYSNAVLGARSNFEGGPSALSAGLTGRTPRYGYHLDRCRRGTRLFEVTDRSADLAEWGALGGIVGRQMSSYWDVPVITGLGAPVTSDEIKQFGAALASFGSTPLFHMVGVTPEAPDLASIWDGPAPAARRIGAADIAALMASYRPKDDRLDVVVFAAPQLSLFEMQTLGALLDGRRIAPGVALLAATSPDIKSAADRMGITAQIEGSGAMVLSGVCFYQMYAREIGQANGWTRLMSNSAKIVNILGGYGYEPVLDSMEACVASAVAGRIVGRPA